MDASAIDEIMRRRGLMVDAMTSGAVTVEGMADLLSVHERTVYRYISDLRNAGFDIVRSGSKGAHTYFIAEPRRA